MHLRFLQRRVPERERVTPPPPSIFSAGHSATAVMPRGRGVWCVVGKVYAMRLRLVAGDDRLSSERDSRMTPSVAQHCG